MVGYGGDIIVAIVIWRKNGWTDGDRCIDLASLSVLRVPVRKIITGKEAQTSAEEHLVEKMLLTETIRMKLHHSC